MAELTQEQKEFIAIARARKAAAEKAEAEGRGVKEREQLRGDPMSQLNKGLAALVSGIPELITAGSRMQGRKTGGTPTELVEKGFEEIGAPVAERPPETPLEYIGQVGGEAAAFAFPMGKAAQMTTAATKGVGALGGAAKSMNQMLVQSPIQAAAIEGGAVAGQGIARSVAEDQGYSPAAQMGAEVVGGLAGGFAGSGPLQRLAVGGAKKALNPFTEATSMDRAANRLRQVTDDVPLSVKNIEKNIDTGLHPSAMTEDPGLMAMEQTIAAHDPALGTKMAKQTSDAVDNLIEAIRSEAKAGKMADVKKVLAANTKRTKAALDARIEISGERAKKALDDIGDVATEADISRIQRKELQAALDEASLEEDKLWTAIPKNAKTRTKSVMGKYKELMEGLPIAQKDNMPAKAKQLLGGSMEVEMIPSGVIDPRTKEMIMLEGKAPTGKLGKTTTLKELDGLYKELGTAASEARKASNNNTARIAEELREAILEDMKHVKGDNAAKESVGKAREFSKQKNEKFNKGTIGKILGTAKGSVGVNEELTLASGVGQMGLKGDLAAREIATATGKDVRELGAVQEFIKRKFLDHSLVDGVIEPSKARDFIAKNPELMENYPHLRDQFRSARRAEDVSRSIKKSSEALRKKLDSPSVSKTAKILNAPVHEEVNNIFKSADPEAAMQNVVNAVRRDKTGEATKGLRSGIAEYMINLIKSGDASVDIKNRPLFSGAKLKSALTKESSRKAMEKVFNKKEMANWDKMADTLILLRRQQDMKGVPAKSIIGDGPGYITELIGKFGGVKAASLLSRHTGGGGSIQIPAMGGEIGKKVVRKMGADKAEQVLIDALTDNPELLKALYMRKTKANDKLFDLQWRKYLARSGSRLLFDEASDEVE